MSESWCTCSRAYPTGWNMKDCPVHDRKEVHYDPLVDDELVEFALWISNVWDANNSDDRESAKEAVNAFLKGEPR